MKDFDKKYSKYRQKGDVTRKLISMLIRDIDSIIYSAKEKKRKLLKTWLPDVKQPETLIIENLEPLRRLDLEKDLVNHEELHCLNPLDKMYPELSKTLEDFFLDHKGDESFWKELFEREWGNKTLWELAVLYYKSADKGLRAQNRPLF